MKNANEITRKFVLVLLFAAAITLGPGYQAAPYSCDLPTVTRADAGTTWVTYNWTPAIGSSYKIWYVRLADSYTGQAINTSGGTAPFSGLTPGTYRIYFQVTCAGGQSSEIIIEDVIIG